MKIKDMTREDFIASFDKFLETAEDTYGPVSEYDFLMYFLQTLEFEDDTSTKPTFEQWKAKVDEALFDLCGMESNTLPDYDYLTAWAEGIIPEECAEDVIEYVDRLNAK